jgi:hypothetical protein
MIPPGQLDPDEHEPRAAGIRKCAQTLLHTSVLDIAARKCYHLPRPLSSKKGFQHSGMTPSIRTVPALFALLSAAAGIAPPAAAQQPADTPGAWNVITPLVPIGGAAEESLRLRQLLGEVPTDGYLIRSTSTLTGTPGRGEAEALLWSIVPPTIDFVWNSDLPFALNQGGLWAGRGSSAQVTAGVQLVRGPVRLILAPTVEYSQNQDFQVIPADSAGRSQFTLPWRAGRHSADLPLRFGDRPLHLLHLGQSSLTYRAGGVAGGPRHREPVVGSRGPQRHRDEQQRARHPARLRAHRRAAADRGRRARGALDARRPRGVALLRRGPRQRPPLPQRRGADASGPRSSRT